ncbi:choline/glycine/proline betaine transport protein [Salinimicrobium catena]|uniref:Choline/glycine/proline betaine transport protein n=1 Tax=Salinimicrobium catena TaxID=390640 RepID=A0A1H5N2U6_9FLAO|nr:BCCT family transporter [Salinimicrobium catena]SDL35521.1 choline/glycine/proline betaine transport protein [Salinimicrobium catena]SEE95939.1 choline/glycine/proline betaine transport protein [Salinimicrobium catena]
MAKKIVRSDERKSIMGLDVNGPVFFTSSIIIIISIALTLIYREQAEGYFDTIQAFVSNNGGWFFVLCVNIFLIFVLYLAFSKFGSIRIGGKDAKPEFKTLSWFAMLFSAGMGIGLLFWSIAEPVTHFMSPPLTEGGTPEAAQEAMNFTFLHWGFHAWGIYALVGLSLAYFTYSHGLPLTIRSVFYPVLGDKIYGKRGDIIDIFAVLATLFGLATSLGLGVQQIAAGLAHVFGVDSGITTQVLLIAGITAIATVSVVLGVDKGVKFLSEWNMRIAVLMLLLVLILGPTIFIFQSFVQNTGNYLYSFLEISSWTESYTGNDWQNAWTVFYWGWWIAWSPFVGMFIARISKGRSIREFILGVLIVPSVITFFWISAFGSTSIQQSLMGDETIINAVDENVATALFVFLEDFPFSVVLNIIGVVLIAGFFVTSSDSGSLVVDSLTSGGKIDAPVGQRVFWAVAEGAVAAVLLIGGGLQALQTASIVTGLPFAFILLFMCYSLYTGVRDEYLKMEEKKAQKELESYEEVISDIIKKRGTKPKDDNPL